MPIIVLTSLQKLFLFNLQSNSIALYHYPTYWLRKDIFPSVIQAWKESLQLRYNQRQSLLSEGWQSVTGKQNTSQSHQNCDISRFLTMFKEISFKWLFKLHVCAHVHMHAFVCVRVCAFWVHVWSCVCMHVCACALVEVGGQLAGVHSLLPPCGFQGSTSGCQAWQQFLSLLSYFASTRFFF